MLTPNAILAVIGEHVRIGGIGYTWPIPHLDAGALHATVLVFRRSVTGRSRQAFPPHEALVIDPETGKLVGRRARPLGAGVDVDRPLQTAAPRGKVDPDTWRAAKARFSDIAPRVWEAYAARSTNKALRGLVMEYRGQLALIELPEMVPFHAEIGGDFHAWIQRISEAP